MHTINRHSCAYSENGFCQRAIPGVVGANYYLVAAAVPIPCAQPVSF